MLMHSRLLDFDNRVLERLPVAVYVCEACSGRIKYYNRRAVELWGIAPHEVARNHGVYGCGAFKLCMPDGTPIRCDQTPMCSVLREGVAVRDWEALVQRPDGSCSNVLVNVEPIRDECGRIVAAISTFQEITKQRRADEYMREAIAQAQEINQELLFQKFALDQHAIVAVTDPKGRITYANDKFCQISQYSQEELLGQDHRIVNSGYHPRQRHPTKQRG